MSWLPNWLTGFDEENYQAGLRADEANRQRNLELSQRGLITVEEYEQTEARFTHPDYNVDPDKDIGRAFNEGLDEGAANIRNTVGGTINTVVSTPLKIIPWQLWVAGLAFIAWQLGLLRGLIKK